MTKYKIEIRTALFKDFSLIKVDDGKILFSSDDFEKTLEKFESFSISRNFTKPYGILKNDCIYEEISLSKYICDKNGEIKDKKDLFKIYKDKR